MKRILMILTLLMPLVAMAQSPLYQRYATRSDLTVAEVRGFLLNDSVRVDVVLVEADNEAAWQQLKDEFDIRSSEGSTSWLAPLSAPTQRTRWDGTPRWRCIANHARHTIGFYRLDTEQQYDALLDYQLNHPIKTNNNKNK